MTGPIALPIVTLLVWTPAAGALVSAFPGEARAALRRTLSLGFATLSLALASYLAIAFERGANPRELGRWVPPLGLSHDLAVDGFGSVVVLWISLLAVLSLASDGSRALGRRSTCLILVAETALLGLATAGDAVLFLVFYGVGLLSFALLLGRSEDMKRFFLFQSAGATLALAYVAISYHLAWVQTGFPSAEMGRFPTLVSFPDFQTRMLLLGTSVLIFACPLVPFTSWVSGAAAALGTPGRVMLLGGWSLAGSLFFVRAVIPSYSPHGSLGASLLAALSVLYAGLAPRRAWGTLLVGFQGLLVLRLLAPTAEGGASGRAGILQLALALAAIALSIGDSEVAPGPARTGAIAAGALLLPFGLALREPWRTAPTLTVLAALGLILMAFRLVRTLPPLSWRRSLLLLPLVVGIWILPLATPSRIGPAGGTPPATEGEE